MRETKFQFPRKTIDPTNLMAVKAILKQEAFFTASNATLLNSYFLAREFIHQIVESDTDDNLTINGSHSFPAYRDPFRIPTDLDLQAQSIGKAIELIKDTISTINNKNDGYSVNLVEKGTTSNDVVQYRADAKLFDMQTSFMLDIQPSKEQINRKKLMLKKLISTDEEFFIPVQPVETMLANKILSILNKVGEDRCYYRTKDFYDIYMLIEKSNVDVKKIDQSIEQEISRKINSGVQYDRYKLANTREKLPEITKDFDSLWGKMSNRLEVVKSINPSDVRKFGINLIDEMSL